MSRADAARALGDGISRLERGIFIAGLAVIAALRLLYVSRFRIDTDEPQHLHVAWGWTQGLVQYRDFFDNHTPLFHMLMSPLVAAIGERPDIIVLMRYAMFPLVALTLWASYALARSLFGRRTAMWSTLFLGLCPVFFGCSIEFRTDNLWVMLLTLVLLTFLGGRLTRSRALLGGFLLGAAACVSLKTTIMLLALPLALLLLTLISAEFRRSCSWRSVLSTGVLVLAGLCVLPLCIMFFFWHIGAWDSFVYCTVRHSIVEGRHHAAHWMRVVRLMILLTSLAWAVKQLLGQRPRGESRVPAQMVFLFLLTGAFLSILLTVWPVVERQTVMALFPPLIVSLTGLPLAIRMTRTTRSQPSTPGQLPALRSRLTIVTLEAVILTYSLFSAPNLMPREQRFLAEVLKITNASDCVLDAKGEMVFRPRSYYYVLEKFTKRRLRMRILPDQIPERCVATRTCVVVNERHAFPPRTQAFMKAAYVRAGDVSVAGQIIESHGSSKNKPVRFDLLIPTTYSIVTNTGRASGRLDGQPYKGPRFLSAGRHVFLPDKNTPPLAAVWSQAIERGFSPFRGKAS